MEISQSDTAHLLTLLPDVAWTKVLEQAKDTSTWEKIYNSSQFFRNRLSAKSVEVLFANVFPLLQSELYKLPTNTSQQNSSKTCSECERSRKVKYFSDVLNIRQVSQNWKNVVDDSLNSTQKENCKYEPQNHGIDEQDRFVKEMARDIYEFGDCEEDLEEFEHHFLKTPHANPFFNHAVRFNIDLDMDGCTDNVEERQAAIDNIISKYGEQLWYCNIHIDCFYTPINCFRQIHRMLQNMPNLQRLELIMSAQFYVDELEESCVTAMNKQIAAVGQWPYLPKLERITVYDVPCMWLKALFQANPHVKAAKISRCTNLIMTEALPHAANLEELSVTTTGNHDFRVLSSLRLTQTVRKFECVYRYNTWVKWSEILSRLEHLNSEMLTDLIIEFPGTFEIKKEEKLLYQCESFLLNMSNIKRLRMIIPNIMTLDFILPLAKILEVLDLEIGFNLRELGMLTDKRIEKLQKEQKIEFLGYVDNLQKSNIWTLFPQLQKVSCKESYLERTFGGYPKRDKHYTFYHTVLRYQVMKHQKHQNMKN